MAFILSAGLTLQFLEYDITDATTRVRFYCAAPGGGMPSDYWIELTDADLGTITNAATFSSLVLTKLRRKYRAATAASKLDARIGQSVVL